VACWYWELTEEAREACRCVMGTLGSKRDPKIMMVPKTQSRSKDQNTDEDYSK